MTAPQNPCVTQADREAAQALCASGWTHAIEAFARHRTTALAAKEAENVELRAKVEKLREVLGRIAGQHGPYSHSFPESGDGYAAWAVLEARATLAETQP